MLSFNNHGFRHVTEDWARQGSSLFKIKSSSIYVMYTQVWG